MQQKVFSLWDKTRSLSSNTPRAGRLSLSDWVGALRPTKISFNSTSSRPCSKPLSIQIPFSSSAMDAWVLLTEMLRCELAPPSARCFHLLGLCTSYRWGRARFLISRKRHFNSTKHTGARQCVGVLIVRRTSSLSLTAENCFQFLRKLRRDFNCRKARWGW